MPKFRKKPVVIEARHWDGTLVVAHELQEWIARAEGVCSVGHGLGHPPELKIVTLEGIHDASPGDWIICGVKGEFYPCKPDIFAATYDTAD